MNVAREATPRRIVAWVFGLCAAGFVFDSVRRIALRMRFDYDVLLWADDYFMTSMFKLSAGEPVYGPVAEANSTVYAPGGPYLHYLLLAPFGFETSLFANRVLNLVWLALSVVLATAAVVRSCEEPGHLGGPARRLGLLVMAFLVVALAALVNPVIDSLHPTNLELCIVGTTALALARFDVLSGRAQIACAIVLAPLALFFKQTAAVPVATALAFALFERTSGRLSLRLGWGSLPFVSLGLGFAALVLWTDGGFWTWGVSVLAHHPFEWWKASDIYAGFFLLFVPACAVALFSVWLSVRGSAFGGHSKIGILVVAYVPFALAALFKTMGGPNNLAVLGFLVVVFALPTWLFTAFGVASKAPSPGLVPVRSGVKWTALALLAVQVLVLYPRRRVPTDRDLVLAEMMCDYAAARSRCGEKVFLGRGAVCLHRGGVAVPEDRMMSIIEATVAGRGDELHFYDRVREMDYDVMIFWIGDLEWGGKRLWDLMRVRYRPFFTTRGQLEGDFWYHGWQGYVTWPVVYWERATDAGSHRLGEPGRRCADRRAR